MYKWYVPKVLVHTVTNELQDSIVLPVPVCERNVCRNDNRKIRVSKASMDDRVVDLLPSA